MYTAHVHCPETTVSHSSLQMTSIGVSAPVTVEQADCASDDNGAVGAAVGGTVGLDVIVVGERVSADVVETAVGDGDVGESVVASGQPVSSWLQT